MLILGFGLIDDSNPDFHEILRFHPTSRERPVTMEHGSRDGIVIKNGITFLNAYGDYFD